MIAVTTDERCQDSVHDAIPRYCNDRAMQSVTVTSSASVSSYEGTPTLVPGPGENTRRGAGLCKQLRGAAKSHGAPRPVHIDHALAIIQSERTAEWAAGDLVNTVEARAEGDSAVRERVGLSEFKFIEVRWRWFTRVAVHRARNNVYALSLVESDDMIVESASGVFEPFIVHHAEILIVPGTVGEYATRPFGRGAGTRRRILEAHVGETERCHG